MSIKYRASLQANLIWQVKNRDSKRSIFAKNLMKSIQYYLLTPPTSEPQSPFQGFNFELMNGEFIKLMHALTSFPHAVHEIFLDQEKLILSRMKTSPRSVSALSSEHLAFILQSERPTVTVIICLPAQLDQVQIDILQMEVSPIIVSTVSRRGVINCLDKSLPPVFLLDSEILARAKQIQNQNGIFTTARPLRQPYSKKTTYTSIGAGVTFPNELILESLGFSSQRAENINPFDNENYIDAIIKSAQDIINIENIKNNQDDYRNRGMILYTPSIYATLYDFKQNFWNQIFRKSVHKWCKEFAKNGIFRNKFYSGWTSEIVPSANPYHDPILGPMLLTRQLELKLTGFGIAQLTTSAMVPALRLPNSINLHLPALQDIENHLQETKKNSNKLSQRRFREYVETLRSDIGEKLLTCIKDNSSELIICSDAPIEWISVSQNGPPLMITHEVSKIPMTPGNMLLQYCMPGAEILIKLESIRKILVIRSFDHSDQIKGLLEQAINGYPISDSVSVTYKDVRTISEVKDALNAFDGSILIFDCHGSHGGKADTGWLHIGNEKLNTWELAHIARVPPIVLLSACLTSPIAGSHASVANGLLRSGAFSVLGTFLAVDAIASAIFVARLIFRVDSFLSAIVKLGFERISWRKIISGFLQMSYATDVLRYLESSRFLTEKKDYMDVHLNANFDINSGSPDWYDNLLNRVAKVAGVEKSLLESKINIEHPLMDTLMYCHLGRPDLLQVVLQ